MIRIFCDQDGVISDFQRGVRDLGIKEGMTPETRDEVWSKILKTDGFFKSLSEMPGAKELYNAIQKYNPIILTGVINGNEEMVAQEKKEWMEEHFDMDHIIVTDSKRKTDFMCPGDILIDDNEDNVKAWQERGGIGILYNGDIKALENAGLINGGYTPELLQRIRELQSRPEYKRNGYTEYRFDKMRNLVVEKYMKKFPSFSKYGTKYNNKCDHITRSFPAGDDITFDTYPDIKIVGAIHNDDMGVNVLVCSVDGSIERPCGGYYHITYSLDNDCPDREKKPLASDSNKVIMDYVKEYGVNALFNLPPQDQMEFKGVFHYVPGQTKKPKPEKVVNKVTTREPCTFSDGIEGFHETSQNNTVKNEKYYYEKDGKNIMHNPDGPAIINTKDGKVSERYMLNGKLCQESDLPSKGFNP